MQNEVNVYNPEIKAVVAKVNDFDEIEDDILDFAYENNLPILILGKF